MSETQEPSKAELSDPDDSSLLQTRRDSAKSNNENSNNITNETDKENELINEDSASTSSTIGSSVSQKIKIKDKSDKNENKLIDPKLAIHKQNKQKALILKLENEINQILKDYPDGITIDSLESIYQTTFGFSLPYKETKFSTTKELIKSLQSIITIAEVNENIFVSTSINQGIQPINKDERGSSLENVDENLCKNIHKLLLSWPSGMPLLHLPKKFEEEYKKNLPIEENGIDELQALIASMPKYVRMTKEFFSETTYFIHAVSANENDDYPVQSLLELSIQSKHQWSNIHTTSNVQHEMQNIVCNTTEIIPQTTCFLRIAEENPIPYILHMQNIPSYDFTAFVAHIYNPDKFYIHVVGPLASSALEQLLVAMERYYNNLTHEDVISKHNVFCPTAGTLLAAPFNNDGNYYRAEVLSVISYDEVSLYYVDYGNKAVVPASSLRRLKGLYVLLPAQGIECRLANPSKIKNFKWKASSILRLKDIVDTKQLRCRIVNKDATGVLNIVLNEKTNKNQSINEQLTSEGHSIQENVNTYLQQHPPIHQVDNPVIQNNSYPNTSYIPVTVPQYCQTPPLPQRMPYMYNPMGINQPNFVPGHNPGFIPVQHPIPLPLHMPAPGLAPCPVAFIPPYNYMQNQPVFRPNTNNL